MRRLFSLISMLAVLSLAVPVAAQAPAAKTAAAKPAASGVDTVISLVKGGMSESMVIKSLKRENKAYELSPADLLKLQKAGISERVIDAMSDPGAGGGEPAVVTASTATAPHAARAAANGAVAEAGGAVTAFPPDLADVPSAKK